MKQLQRELDSRRELTADEAKRFITSKLLSKSLLELEKFVVAEREMRSNPFKKVPLSATLLANLAIDSCTAVVLSGRSRTFTSAVMRLARSIQEAVQAKAVYTDNKEQFLAAIERIKNQKTKMNRIEASKDLKSLWIDADKLDEDFAISIAGSLIYRLLELGTVVSPLRLHAGTKRERLYLEPAEDAAKDLVRATTELRVRTDMPMTELPIDWSIKTSKKGVKFWSGGYISYRKPFMILKNGAAQLSAEEMEAAQEHVDGANRLQRTAWEINPTTLRLVKMVRKNAWEHRLGEKAMLPINKRTSQAVAAQGSVIAIAEEFQHEQIYFVYQIDWRGRYNAVGSLTPQRAHWVKGLLRFAEKQPLTRSGWLWLSLHAGNCAGDDKLSLRDAFRWAERNWNLVEAVARDPEGTFEQWCGFADPLAFVATCIELVDAKLAFETGRQAWTQQPIGIDASCSGSQIMAARNRDPLVGRLTNLVPQRKKADLYAVVVDYTKPFLQRVAHAPTDEGEWAGRWLEFGWTRSVVKRAVLAAPYGCQRYGVATMLLEDTIEDNREFFADRATECMTKASFLIHGGIDEAMPLSAQFRDTLRRLADVCSRVNKQLEWVIPTGLTVRQAYFEQVSRRINYHTTGKRQKVNILANTGKVHQTEAHNGASPNLVHSLDAALACRLALAMPQEAPLHFVHDSFGTTANMMPTLFQSVRSEFVRMFKESDPLADAVAKTFERLGPELDNTDRVDLALNYMPELGDLDLEGVKRSQFCFR